MRICKRSIGAVEEFAKEVQKEVKELLGVDDAQLEAAMKELGLTYQDLMDPVNLANLVMNLTGEEDQLGLFDECGFSGTDAECGSFK